MKSIGYKKNEEITQHSLDVMLKNYSKINDSDTLYRKLKLNEISFLLDTYEEMGYDLVTQRIKYQDYENKLV